MDLEKNFKPGDVIRDPNIVDIIDAKYVSFDWK